MNGASNDSDQKLEQVFTAFTANVWEVKCKVGEDVTSGQTLIILEAMKMEYPVAAPLNGKIIDIFVESSSLTHQGDTLITIAPRE